MIKSPTPKQIKREVKLAVQALLRGRTHAGGAVFVSRSIPTQHEEGPVVLIYTTGESVEVFDQSPKRYRRVLSLRIECITTGNDDDDLDLRLEELGERVEALMEIDETLGGLANKLELSGSDYQVEPTAQSPTGLLALSFNVELFTYAQRPGETCLDDFNQAFTQWKVGHNQGPADQVIDAEERISLNE